MKKLFTRKGTRQSDQPPASQQLPTPTAVVSHDLPRRQNNSPVQLSQPIPTYRIAPTANLVERFRDVGKDKTEVEGEQSSSSDRGDPYKEHHGNAIGIAFESPIDHSHDQSPESQLKETKYKRRQSSGTSSDDSNVKYESAKESPLPESQSTELLHSPPITDDNNSSPPTRASSSSAQACHTHSSTSSAASSTTAKIVTALRQPPQQAQQEEQTQQEQELRQNELQLYLQDQQQQRQLQQEQQEQRRQQEQQRQLQQEQQEQRRQQEQQRQLQHEQLRQQRQQEEEQELKQRLFIQQKQRQLQQQVEQQQAEQQQYQQRQNTPLASQEVEADQSKCDLRKIREEMSEMIRQMALLKDDLKESKKQLNEREEAHRRQVQDLEEQLFALAKDNRRNESYERERRERRTQRRARTPSAAHYEGDCDYVDLEYHDPDCLHYAGPSSRPSSRHGRQSRYQYHYADEEADPRRAYPRGRRSEQSEHPRSNSERLSRQNSASSRKSVPRSHSVEGSRSRPGTSNSRSRSADRNVNDSFPPQQRHHHYPPPAHPYPYEIPYQYSERYYHPSPMMGPISPLMHEPGASRYNTMYSGIY